VRNIAHGRRIVNDLVVALWEAGAAVRINMPLLILGRIEVDPSGKTRGNPSYDPVAHCRTSTPDNPSRHRVTHDNERWFYIWLNTNARCYYRSGRVILAGLSRVISATEYFPQLDIILLTANVVVRYKLRR